MNVWVEFLKQSNHINLKDFSQDARQIRRAMSELRKVGIYFIPVGNYRYERINEETDVDRYVQREIKHLATQYFNTVKPLIALVKDQQKQKMYGNLFKNMEELR